MKDKTLLNAAGIISLVMGIGACLTIVGAIIGIPAIIGGIKLRELSTLSEEEIIIRKDTLLVWSIVLLIICTISGILSLIYYIGLENPNIFNSSNNKYYELEKINSLYKEKILTKEEFEKEKERILNR